MRPLLSLSHLDFPCSNLPLLLPPLSLAPRGALGFGVEITGIWIPGGEFFRSPSLLSPSPSPSLLLPLRAPLLPPRRRGSPLPAPARWRPVPAPPRRAPDVVRHRCGPQSPARPPGAVWPRRGPLPRRGGSAPARRPGPGATRVAPFTPNTFPRAQAQARGDYFWL
jgi:hypothetical protein